MKTQTVLLAALAALACLGVTQAIRCYACVHATKTLPKELGNVKNDDKCLNPVGSKLKSVEAPNSANLKLEARLFLDPLVLQHPDDLDFPKTLLLTELINQFATSAKSNSSKQQPECKVYCVEAHGKLDKLGAGTVTARAFIAASTYNQIVKPGCQTVQGSGVRLCFCDKDECNSNLNSASGLGMSFGLIAVLALFSEFLR